MLISLPLFQRMKFWKLATQIEYKKRVMSTATGTTTYSGTQQNVEIALFLTLYKYVYVYFISTYTSI